MPTQKTPQKSKRSAVKNVSVLKPKSKSNKSIATKKKIVSNKKKRSSKEKTEVVNEKNKESTEKRKKVVVKKNNIVEKKNMVVIRKKAHVHFEKHIFKDNVDDIMDDILEELAAKRIKRVVGGKKLPKNVPHIKFENISFHFEESVLKWKYVFH